MNFEKLEKHRVKSGLWATSEGESRGLFFIPTKGVTPLKVLSSGYGDEEWHHVSVSLPNRCPTWEEMSMIKNLFYGDEVVIQYHPKKSEYVDNHPYCLHLWGNLKEEIKTPPSYLVGIK